MSTGLLVVHIQGYGQTWSNTHGVAVGDPAGPMGSADMQTLADAAPAGGYTDVNTNPSNGSYPTEPGIIQAILGFTRLMTSKDCQVTGFTLSDGTTPGSATGPFWSQNFSLPCLNDLTGDTVAPLSIAWLIGKVPATVGVRTGHINFRAALSDDAVKPGSRTGVQWTNDARRADASDYLDDSQDNSHLTNFFNAQVSSPTHYVIPVYAAGPPNAGHVISGHFVTGLTSINPTSRQKPRGRKRA